MTERLCCSYNKNPDLKKKQLLILGKRAACDGRKSMEAALQALQKYFGIDNFRGLQERVITEIFARNDVLCTLPTGAGKSICYTTPFLARSGSVVLVVSPLISLIQDQVSDKYMHAAPGALYFAPYLSRETG